MKLAIVSHVLPPSSSGQAIVLYRLLKDLDPGSYCLISHRRYNSKIQQESYTGKLSGRYYKILPEFRFRQDFLSKIDPIIPLIDSLLAFAGVLFRGIQIARILKKEKCSAIMACTADLVNVPAGYLASRLVGIPYYAYIFDYYSCQWMEPCARFFASLFEPIILRGAAKVIVPNEFLRDELAHRYGIEAVVIHNPNDMVADKAEVQWPSKEGEISIVYTGAIYYAHYDAFLNLISAIEKSGRKDVRLHIYTAVSHSLLESVGIHGPVIYHDHLELSESLEVQRHADVLFLPLAFDSSNQEIIKTSAPGKMGEYLASGRPILVHAPADSFVSWYFREHGCGLVIDVADANVLAKSIRDIIENKSLRNKLVANALQCSSKDFNIVSVRDMFLKLFDTQRSKKCSSGDAL